MTTHSKDQAPRLRLAPALKPRDLPAHPLLTDLQKANSTSSSTEPPSLLSFARAILDEATTFTDEQVSQTFTDRGNKSSPPSAAKVRLLTSDLIPGEAWFGRRSIHAPLSGGRNDNGSASYAEFEHGLFDDHSAHEMDYTPSVFDAVEVLNWDEAIATAAATASEAEFPYTDVHMCIQEMCHRIPSPVTNRVFSILLLRGKPRSLSAPTASSPDPAPADKEPPAQGHPCFVVVQIPVDASQIASAMYSNGRHRTEGDTAEKRGKVVLGAYVSVERVRVLPHAVEEGKTNGTDKDSAAAGAGAAHGQGAVDWLMATASDAKGHLPMALQKLGLPGAVVKDVGWFIDWTVKRRGKNATPTASTATPTATAQAAAPASAET